MTRRSLLKKLLLYAFVAVYTALLWRDKWVRYHILNIIKPHLNVASQTGLLSNAEKETIIAFAEVLVKAKGVSVEERRYIIEHIDYRTQNTPGYLSTYRTTAHFLNRLTHSQFSTLDFTDRLTAVLRHDLISHHVQMWEYLNPFQRQELTIRTYVVPDIVRGFYSSPAGWAVVGYETFPGRRGTLLRYTHSEA